MHKKTDLTIPMTVIVATMAMALIYFWIYRSGLTGFNTRRPLKLNEVAIENMALLDTDNLPDNYIWSQNLLLVNKDHPLPEAFVPEISFYKTTDVPMNSCMHLSYASLSEAVIARFNNKMFVESSYRSHEHQAEIYEEEGSAIAAVPGTSEHETGLALDVYVNGFGGAAFIKSEEGKFVNAHCHEFGFIIRYPNGDQNITGFEYEPWHIRYVGIPHSILIANSGITFEEYVDFFKIGTYYSYDSYLIARMPEDAIYVPSEYFTNSITLSPDNCGYVFVTIEI